MKNRRDVCYARDAGFIQFDGLPGLIKTGCTATPAYKSHYCSEHTNRVCELEVRESVGDDEMDKPTGPALRSHLRKHLEYWERSIRDGTCQESNKKTNLLSGIITYV